jgi:hypothetical protein
MIQTIINCIASFLVTTCLSVTLKKIKKFKETENNFMKEFEGIKDSQLMDMKSDLSNKFFVYDAMTEVEDYLVMAFREKCERYFSMGGDTWIHPMYDKSFTWKIKHTGYLQ